jgi:uncharacterized membrane protein HdeD (DUF308 family)
MKLYDNWRTILKKAWSLKFLLIALVLECASVILPFYTDVISRQTFTALIIVCIIGSGISRIVYQNNV